MFMAITGAIFTGGGGAVVLGGLYWKRGTTAAAWTAMITGCVLSVTAMIIRQIQQSHPFDGQIMSYIASKNSLVLGFWASIAALASYVIVSLVGKHNIFNMNKMLHRGEYAVEELEIAKSKSSVSGIRALIGMGSEFTTGDKAIYLSTMGWTVLLILLFVAGTIYNFAVKVKTDSWSNFWHGYIWVLLTLSVITTLWFLICGFRDLKNMLAKLRTIKRDISDDGAVGKHVDVVDQQKKTDGILIESENKD
jgi:SSS family solute:Na+ symporter